MDPDVDFAEIWAPFDILLMGRRTYEFAREGFERFGTQGTKIVVVSRTLRAEDHPKVKIISELTPESIASLRSEAQKDVWLFGGGELFRSLLSIGAVDRIEVSIVAILLGAGVPFLPSCLQRTGLRLVEQTTARGKGSSRQRGAKQ